MKAGRSYMWQRYIKKKNAFFDGICMLYNDPCYNSFYNRFWYNFFSTGIDNKSEIKVENYSF